MKTNNLKRMQWVLTDGKKVLWNTATDILKDSTSPTHTKPTPGHPFYWVKKQRSQS